MSYECKVSVADFRSDVTSGKWQGYLEFSSGVYFAVPRGLVPRSDIPDRAGLIVRGNSGWRVARKATLSPCTIPQDVLLKLLIDGVEREGPRIRARYWDESQVRATIAKKFGQDVADVLRDLDGARRRVEMARTEAEIIVNTAKHRRDAIQTDVGAERALWAQSTRFESNLQSTQP
jgi:hypothetical protein